jgi:hypothetical protein
MTQLSTFFMMLQATRHWHELAPPAQREVFDDLLNHIFNRYPDLRMSHYAVTPVGARCSDLVVWEADDVAQYHEAVDALRRQAFFGAPLFEIVEVIAGVAADGGGRDDLVSAPLAMLAL